MGRLTCTNTNPVTLSLGKMTEYDVGFLCRQPVKSTKLQILQRKPPVSAVATTSTTSSVVSSKQKEADYERARALIFSQNDSDSKSVTQHEKKATSKIV